MYEMILQTPHGYELKRGEKGGMLPDFALCNRRFVIEKTDTSWIGLLTLEVSQTDRRTEDRK